MIYTGVVSVTFRKLEAIEIINLAAKAGLDGIEWGGDIHVPSGDTGRARQVRKATLDAGLKVASYGSYYRVGTYSDAKETFKEVLSTAMALEAPNIRVWAGNQPSAAAGEDTWRKAIEESRLIADLAEKEGIKVSYEYHGNTLTDSPEAAFRLLSGVNHSNLYTYWQPAVGVGVSERIQGLQAIRPWLSNIHVFQWRDRERLELEAGAADWVRYFNAIEKGEGDRFALLEFVAEDSPVQFLKDAKTLIHWVRK